MTSFTGWLFYDCDGHALYCPDQWFGDAMTAAYDILGRSIKFYRPAPVELLGVED